MRQVGGQAAYLSQDMLDPLFGLGEADRASIEVVWPDGLISEESDMPAGSSVQFRRTEEGKISVDHH